MPSRKSAGIVDGREGDRTEKMFFHRFLVYGARTLGQAAPRAVSSRLRLRLSKLTTALVRGQDGRPPKLLGGLSAQQPRRPRKRARPVSSNTCAILLLGDTANLVFMATVARLPEQDPKPVGGQANWRMPYVDD